MPRPSSHITNISSSGHEGWEVYVEALRRKQNGETIINLAIGDPDFPSPAPIVEACKQALDDGLHHYSNIEGTPELREALAVLSSEATGIETTAEEIRVTPGGQSALFAAIMATCDTDDHIILNGPYYSTYPGSIRANCNNFTLVENRAENGFQPDAAEIAKAIQPNTKALLINTPNNPTGVIYTKESLQAIADLCIEHDLWLISDEVYWSLTFGAHVSPRSLPHMKERTIVINSLSKSHAMTGWRVGWLTTTKEMADEISKLSLITTYGISPFISKAATLAVNTRAGMKEIANIWQNRRKVLVDPLSKIEAISIVEAPGGMYVMIDIRRIEPDANKFAFALLAEKDIAVTPGNSFGEATKGHLRIALCCPDEKLPETAEALCDFITNYSKD